MGVASYSLPAWTLPQKCEGVLGWIRDNKIGSEGITVSSKNRKPYPEVTGYIIPTLIECGERELAVELGHWLLSIQAENGAFRGPDDGACYVFDTGQIVRGFLALTERGLLDCRAAMVIPCRIPLCKGCLI